MYSTASLVSPYYYVAAMMCRLFGSPNTSKFSIEWVPLMQATSESYIIDWGTIFSNNIASQVLYYRNNRSFTSRTVPPFFMSAYIMDAVCFTTDFLNMGWKWTIQIPTPIHVYHSILWKSKYESHFYKICHGVIFLLYQVFFGDKAPILSKEA